MAFQINFLNGLIIFFFQTYDLLYYWLKKCRRGFKVHLNAKISKCLYNFKCVKKSKNKIVYYTQL